MVVDNDLFNTYTFSVLIFGAVEIIFYVNKGAAGSWWREVQRDILTHLSGSYVQITSDSLPLFYTTTPLTFLEFINIPLS